MKIKGHIVSSGIISSIIYALTNSPLSGLASFLAGVFIDLDHLVDYYLNYGFDYRFKEVFEAFNNFKLPKIYVFLHSFELLAIFWISIFLFPLNQICFAIGIGVTQHIFLDQIYNPITPKAYFLSYRLANKFKKESVFNPSRLQIK